MLKDYDEGYKIIIAGSSGVGKSSLLHRFVDNIYSENLLSTIGVDFKFKTLDILGKKVKMQIWDTAGSEAFRSIVSAYYRGANAVVLVYAIYDKVSFQEMSEFWIEEDINGAAFLDVVSPPRLSEFLQQDVKEFYFIKRSIALT